MAVVQLRNGIYINSIEEVPAAEQTTAYKYASIFTKARKENWEMSQRQAASEIADAKVRDAAAIKSYDAQIAAYNDRLKQLDEDIALTGRDVAKANAATQRTALQEATAKQENAILWEKAKVEGVVVPGASRSRSESDSSGGGGGGGGGAGSKQKDADDLVNIEIGNQGDGARDPSALQAGLKRGALNSANISNTDPAVVAAAKAGAMAASIGILATGYRNGGYSEAAAYDTAYAEVKQDLINNGHQDAVDAYDNKQTIDAANSGGRTSRTDSSSSRDASTVQPRYPGLGAMPVADTVTAENTPQVPLDIAALTDARIKLAAELAQLIKDGAPASEVDDFITRSREIMAGRFGRVAESPNFYQRNVAQAILTGRMTNEDIADLKSKYANEKLNRAINRPGADPNAAGSAAPVSPDSSGATPTTEPIVPDGSTPAVSPDASGATPDRLTRPEPGPTSSGITVTEGGSGGGPGPQPFARLITRRPGVPDYFGEEGLSTMDVENLRLAQRQGLPPEILDAMDKLKKPGSFAPGERPQMPDPSGRIGIGGPFMPGYGDPTPNIGSKPEAAGDFSVPDMPPETPTPGNPDYVPTPAYMPPRQPGLNVTWEQKGYVEPSEEEKKQILDIKQKQREKREGQTGSTLEYFKSRFDNAKQIVDQPGKLARLVASGPGKVAADVYNANKTTGKDFKLTYDTLTATYEDDKEALAVAHQVALALDIAARARTAPPKA